MLTRRHFIGNCSLIVASSCLAPVTVWSANFGASSPTLGTPSFAEFARHVNTSFTVQRGQVTARLLLVKALPKTVRRPDAEVAGNEAFSLQFRGGTHPLLGQDTYEFRHPELGSIPMFIVPIGPPDRAGGHYEAVFNRPVSTAALARQMSRAPRRLTNC